MKKVEVNQKAVEPKSEYPCLKVSQDGSIVLFKSHKVGVVVWSIDVRATPIGYYSDNWFESTFTPFTGTITLSND